MSDQALILLSVEQLTGIIRETVEAAVVEATTGSSKNVPPLLDRNGMAGALGCSVPTVDKLRREGMPHIRVGECPKFDLVECLAWLREKT